MHTCMCNAGSFQIHTHPSANPLKHRKAALHAKGSLSTSLSHPCFAKQLVSEHFNPRGSAGWSRVLHHSSPPACCTPTPGTAEPHSPLAPAPACEPLRHGPAGSPVLRHTALPRAPTDYPLSLSLCETWRETQTERDANFSSRSEPGSPAPVRRSRVGAPAPGGVPREAESGVHSPQ